MAKSRPSVQKRNHEARKVDKAQEKAARKAARRAEREQGAALPDGVDPDLVGQRPGPQPIPRDPVSEPDDE